MKKTLLLLLAVISSFGAIGQEEVRVQEKIVKDSFFSMFMYYGYYKDHFTFFAKHSDDSYFCIIKDGTDKIEKLMKMTGSVNIYVDDLSSIEFDGKIYFTGRTEQEGIELFVSDGSVMNAQLVKDILPGSGGSNPCNFTVYKGKLYFFTKNRTDSSQNGLWMSDGTAAGTQMILPSNKFEFNSLNMGHTESLTAYDDKLYFQAHSGRDKITQLWQTDGTIAGTKKLKEFIDDDEVGMTAMMSPVIFNNKLHFIRRTKRSSNFLGEIWATDGTAAGTQLVMREGGAGGYNGLHVFQNELYFIKRDSLLVDYGDDSVKYQLCKSDGTRSGTTILTKFERGGFNFSALDRLFTEYDNKLFFPFSGRGFGAKQGIYVTDGTAAGTMDLKDMLPLHSDTDALFFTESYKLTVLRKKLFFFSSGRDPKTNAAAGGLWMTDGTSEGTICLTPKYGPGSADLRNVDAGIYNNTLYYSVNYESSSLEGRQLYKLHFPDNSSVGSVSVDALDFSVYPNPSDGNIQINMAQLQSGTIRVFDLLGKLQKTSPFSTTQNINLDLNTLAKGVYMMEIVTESGKKGVKKIVID